MWGESQAVQYLQGKGYEILERNWRSGRFEVDIIATHKNLLVFVEVKTRTSSKYGFPEEAVLDKKSEHLLQAAWQYIENTQYQGEHRIDIISIIKEKNKINLKHIEDAVTPEL